MNSSFIFDWFVSMECVKLTNKNIILDILVDNNNSDKNKD